ncbi:class A beta-lactamase [Marinobacter sp. SS21]|uniref:class A beta-lactamase n=1 Tax=Marinobacter sp. SS21 TaxID=2979460 RepID=UPI00232D9C5C|nr:class A beta-lactamase [Marinobacter sp. SS21]
MILLNDILRLSAEGVPSLGSGAVIGDPRHINRPWTKDSDPIGRADPIGRDATIRYSDNTAANLLLETLGGPEGLTEFMRSVGDDVSRLDRYEPALNTNRPGDERDTTTPSAMVQTMQAVLLADTLSEPLKRLLHTWLIGNTTGDTKLRAGLDPDWIVGDKTGAGERGASNDVAIVWPDEGGPILIAAYYTDSTLPAAARDAIHAEIGRRVAQTLRGGND